MFKAKKSLLAHRLVQQHDSTIKPSLMAHPKCASARI